MVHWTHYGLISMPQHIYLGNTTRTKSRTLTWFLKHLELPAQQPIDVAIAGIVDIAEALTVNPLHEKPALPLTNREAKTLKKPGNNVL